MTPEEFREHGRQLVDWIADYWESLPSLPVSPQTQPGTVTALLPTKAPNAGEGFPAILADLDSVVLPSITHWQHPNFYAYFPANTSGPSVLADLACAGLGVQGMLWATSPACTELETVMLDWLADALDLPTKFRSTGRGGGVIQDSASSATLVALLTALHRASGGRWRRKGIDAQYTVYTSTQGHSSIEKAARIAGLGEQGLRMIEVDPRTLAMDLRLLRAAIEQDRAAGRTPAIVVATIGTTSTTAIDPIARIGEICREFGIWLHVDAAYAGAAAICPELRWSHAGLEFADSYCFDPHKWLLTGFDADAFWVADRGELVEALTVLPEYLRNAASASGAVIDYRDWQVPLGRRFRSLKLWFVLRWYGIEGLRQHIRGGVALAQSFAAMVGADERFEIVADHPFSLVCFRLRDASLASAPGDDRGPANELAAEAADAANLRLLELLNASGALYLTHTRVRGRITLRLAIGAPTTTEADIDKAWAAISAAAQQIAKI